MKRAQGIRMFHVLLDPDLGTPGFAWVNRAEPENTPLPHGHIPDRGNSAHGIGSGFWSMPTPVFEIDAKYGRLPLADVEALARDLWLISDRCKGVLEEIDAEAFEFLAVDTIERWRGCGAPESRYWLCDITRYLDALDEQKSNAIVRMDSGIKRARANRINTEVFRLSVVGDNKIFRLMHAPSSKYMTESFADAIRAAGLTGFMLTEGGKVDA